HSATQPSSPAAKSCSIFTSPPVVSMMPPITPRNPWAPRWSPAPGMGPRTWKAMSSVKHFASASRSPSMAAFVMRFTTATFGCSLIDPSPCLRQFGLPERTKRRGSCASGELWNLRSGGISISTDPVELRFLYVGSDDTEADLAAWLRVPGSRMRWRFQHFGADVAAVDLGSPPLVLIADHRPTGS